MDAYDRAVEVLTAHPEAIQNCWNRAHLGGPGLLFGFFMKDRTHGMGLCLTQIRATGRDDLRQPGAGDDPTPELLAKILADERIPTQPEDITPEMLGPVFAEYMREIDRVLGREAPVWEDVPLEKFS